MVCSITVGCNVSSLKHIREFINSSFGTSVINDDERFNIAWAVDEFCANIFEHGCPENDSKNLLLKTYATKKTFCVVIYDTNEMFDFRQVECPSVEAIVSNRMQGGMGIQLIKHLADGYSIEKCNNGGTIYRFYKYAKNEAV